MKANTKLTLKIYWQHLKKYKVRFFITLVLLISGSIVSNFVPLYYARFFNVFSNGAQKNEQFNELLNILFLIGVFSFVRYFLWRITPFITTTYVSQIQEQDLYTTCFKYLHRHSFSFFNGNFVGSLVKRVHRFVRSFVNIYDNVVWYLMGLCVE
jgi:ATP-binding cassette subfamily B protein